MGPCQQCQWPFNWPTCHMATPHIPPHQVPAPANCLSPLLFRRPPPMRRALLLTCALRAREREHFDPQHRFLYHTGEYKFEFEFDNGILGGYWARVSGRLSGRISTRLSGHISGRTPGCTSDRMSDQTPGYCRAVHRDVFRTAIWPRM